ncbi:MAG: DMT family transporter [Betaproteobacteria bacterium]|nr:DMT family transporter [Betaproteobacteria bacterium]
MKSSNGRRLILVMILWAACFPLITVGLASAPHLTFAALRAILAGTALVALGVILRRPLPSGPAAWGWITAIGLGATTLGFLGMVHAAEFVAPGMATVIANTQPLIAAAVAYAGTPHALAL